MNLERYASLLRETMGLDAASVGNAVVERAVRERATAVFGRADLDAYWQKVNGSVEERQELIEAVVVPETWFFRDRHAFTALAQFAWQWLSVQPEDRVLRILSLPCSTGEEPYSIAMALLDAGVPARRFSIEGVDISARALAIAREALYRRNSFRTADLEFRLRHFELAPDGYRLREPAKSQVEFRQGNLFMETQLGQEPPYQAIFCRNLLIYFDRATQDRAVHSLARRLDPAGALFVAPSETGLMLHHQFEPAGWAGAFAFRKPGPAVLSRAVATSIPALRQKAMAAIPPAGPAPLPAPAVVRKAPVEDTAVPAQLPDVNASAALLDEVERLANAGDLGGARRLCEAFIHSQRACPRAFYLLALVEDSAGNGHSALALYRRVLYLQPDHHEALVHLAVLIERSGDSAAARRLFDRAERLSQRTAGS